MRGAFDGLDVGVQRVPQVAQTACDRDVRHGIALARQFGGQRSGRLVRPAQRTPRIARRGFRPNPIQGACNDGRAPRSRLAPTPGLPYPAGFGPGLASAALQLRDSLEDRGARHPGQPRPSAYAAATFRDGTLGDIPSRLELVQGSQHPQPVPIGFRPLSTRRHSRIVAQHGENSERMRICKYYFLTTP